MYAKDPKAKFWVIASNGSFNAHFTSRNTVHNPKCKHRLSRTNFEVSRLKALASITFISKGLDACLSVIVLVEMLF